MILFLIGYLLVAFVVDYGTMSAWKEYGTPEGLEEHKKVFRVVILLASLIWPATILLAMTRFGDVK